MRSNSDEVEMNNDCFRNLHLTTAYGGASRSAEKPLISCIQTLCVALNWVMIFMEGINTPKLLDSEIVNAERIENGCFENETVSCTDVPKSCDDRYLV